MPKESLTYAYLNGNRTTLVHIDDPRVANGKKCQCICPECGKAVGAWNEGTSQKHHFKHLSSDDCSKGQMTALHRLAQEVLLESRQLMSPAYEKSYRESSKLLCFDSIEIERTEIIAEAHRRPDCIGWINKNKYWIEILVTHEVDKKKIEDISSNGINCIEVDLSDWKDYDFSIDELKERLQNCYLDRKWICNPEHDAKDEEVWELQCEIKQKQEEEIQKKQIEEYNRRQIEVASQREIEAENLRNTRSKLIISSFRKKRLLVQLDNFEECIYKEECHLFSVSSCCRPHIVNLSDYYDICEQTNRIGCLCALKLKKSSAPHLPPLFIEIYSPEEKFAKPGNDEKVIQIKLHYNSYIRFDLPINDVNQNLDVKLHFENKKNVKADFPRNNKMVCMIIEEDDSVRFELSTCEHVLDPIVPHSRIEVRAAADDAEDLSYLEEFCAEMAYKFNIIPMDCRFCHESYFGKCSHKRERRVSESILAKDCGYFNLDPRLLYINQDRLNNPRAFVV